MQSIGQYAFTVYIFAQRKHVTAILEFVLSHRLEPGLGGQSIGSYIGMSVDLDIYSWDDAELYC